MQSCGLFVSGPGDSLLDKQCREGRTEALPVGVLLPLTGKYQWYGHEALHGIQLAVDVANKHADRIRLVVKDTRGDPDLAVRGLESLVLDEAVVSVVGPIFTAQARAVAKRAEALSVPLLALCGAAEISRSGSYVFQTIFSREALIEQLVGHAMGKLGLRNFAVVHPQDSYGQHYADLFSTAVSKRGGRIIRTQSYPPETSDFTQLTQKLVGRFDLEHHTDYKKKRQAITWRYRKNPLKKEKALRRLRDRLRPRVPFEAIFIPDVFQKIALFAPALAAQDVAMQTDDPRRLNRMRKSLGRRDLDLVTLLGTEAWNDPKLVEWAGKHLQGAFFVDAFFIGSHLPEARAFIALYKARFKRPPTRLAAQSFDAGSVLGQALDQPTSCGVKSLRDHLLATQGLSGVTGHFRFDSQGRIERPLLLLTIRDQGIVESPGPMRVSGSTEMPM